MLGSGSVFRFPFFYLFLSLFSSSFFVPLERHAKFISRFTPLLASDILELKGQDLQNFICGLNEHFRTKTVNVNERTVIA